MVNVSSGWKACYRQKLLPETFIEIEYGVTEPGVNAAATITGTLEESFSTTGELANGLSKSPQTYGTLERNSWLLDGSRVGIANPPIDPGYTSSELSSEIAVFTVYPTITITFPSVHTVLIPGITVTWSKAFQEYATKFEITVYNSDSVILSRLVENNTSITSYVENDIQNYDKIVITILEWCQPGRRARIESIFLGSLRIFTKSDLQAFEHTQTVDLLSATLPKNSITFKLSNVDARWNPDSPAGDYKYLQEMQQLSVRYGMRVNGSIEYINGGTFWLTSWSTENTKLEASFTARDGIVWMDDYYTGTRKGTLYAIATAAFEQADLDPLPDGTVRYFVDEVLKQISVDFSEDTNSYTISEILQLVAHAGTCLFRQNAQGVLSISPIDSAIADYKIDNFNSYDEPKITLSKPLKMVSVEYGNNTEQIPVSNRGVVQTVTSPLILTQALAQSVGEFTANMLAGRKTISGRYRANPCMEAGDVIRVQNRFTTNHVCVTSIKYSTTGGGFTGKFEGRIV